MKKNFRVGQSNELLVEERLFDIHNQYGFAGVEVTSSRCVRLLFEPDIEQGRGNPPLMIEFEDVTFLEFSVDFGTRDMPDIAEMGYKSPADRDDEWVLGEDQATFGDHFFLRLSPADYIRVYAEQALLVTRGAKS